MNRRAFLLATAAIVPAAGCASVGQWVDQNLAQVVADVQTVASGIKAILPQVSMLGVDAQTLSTIGSMVDRVVQIGTDIAGVYLGNNAKPLVEELAGLVLAIANVVAGIPGVPSIVLTIIAAAQVLVPAIEKVLGIVGVQAPRGTGPMTIDQARTVLRAYGK